MQQIRKNAQLGSGLGSGLGSVDADWANADLPNSGQLDGLSTLAAYEAMRSLLPENEPRKQTQATRSVSCLTDLISETDAFILDGYGVINVGDDPVPGIAAFLDAAAAANVPVLVLTNGASHPAATRADKYQSWGLPIHAPQIISSRDALTQMLAAQPETGRLLTMDTATTPLGLAGELRLTGNGADDAAILDAADGFVFLGTTGWDAEQNAALVRALILMPRPVYIANPDVAAPQATGFSAEPGFWGLQILQQTGLHPIWAGKPHPPAYRLALARLQEMMGGVSLPYERIAMVGDSLHTDILGANHLGLKSVLLTGYGLLNGLDWRELAEATGIWPDYQTEKL